MTGKRSLAETIRRLDDLERRHDLFSCRVDGWSAWRVMRNAVRRRVCDLPLGDPRRSEGKRMLQALRATVGLVWILLTAPRRELLVKTCRSALRWKVGERFRDVYFDGLLEAGWSALKLESVNSDDFEAQARASLFPSDLDPVVFTFWGRILGTLFPAPCLAFCASVSDLLKRECGTQIDPRWLLMRVSTVRWQARLYSLLLRRLRPRAVLVADTGEYALCIASGRQGVRFVELQHGVFDGDHPDAVPAWVEGSGAQLILPDVLACRGEFWIDQLATTRQGRPRAVAVGQEAIDLARGNRRSRAGEEGVRLVLTSQGLDSPALADWVGRMIAAAPNGLTWSLSIKLHPTYDGQTTAFEVFRDDPRVHIVGGAAEPSVFGLLAAADVHLSIASACHFDAAAIGVKSVVVPLQGHERVLWAIDEDAIVLASDPGDVWRHVTTPPPDPARRERFSRPDFLANFEKLIA
ncbi:MAG: hypothetical protein ACYDBY_14570 [Thermoanaerobaculia bacterium]